MTRQELPLAGIRVVDYSHFLAGPFISRCLAAFGAEVIKVERPKDGEAGRRHAYLVDGQSGYYLQQNMGKKGLCVDVKDPRGLELVRKLVASADVFVENYRPGALKKLGLGYEELSGVNPGLVYCSVSAYGHTGPDAPRPGFGLIAEAKSGIMAMVGTPGQAPPLLRIALGDMYTGSNAVGAICAALFGRTRSGRGQHIDLALYDCLVSMHEYAIQSYTLSSGTEIPQQTGQDLPQSTLYGSFAARDGYVVIAAQVDDAWKRLARLIGGAALENDPRFHTLTGRNENRLVIIEIVRAWVGQHAVAECLALLDEADVPCAKVQNIDEVLADPQIQARGMIVDQLHPVLGPVRMGNLPFHFSECDTTIRTPAPLLGQHNRAVAAALGYSPEQIEAMIADGVLHAEEAVAGLREG